MTEQQQISRSQAWLESLRPKTLPLAFAAIIVGTALAWWQGHFDPLVALLPAGDLDLLTPPAGSPSPESLTVAHALATDGRHEVAAEEAKLRRGVILAQRGHQPAGVEVATRLAHYQIVLHIVRTSTSASIHSRSHRW